MNIPTTNATKAITNNIINDENIYERKMGMWRMADNIINISSLEKAAYKIYQF